MSVALAAHLFGSHPETASARERACLEVVTASFAVRTKEDARLAPLVARMAAGDQQALAAFYDASVTRVFGLLMKIVKDSSVAEEVAHDAYMQAWRSAPDFDPARGNPWAWLLMMTRARALDRLRRDRSRLEHEVTVDTEDEGDRIGLREEDKHDDWLQTRYVRKALAMLPPQQQRALKLAFFTGMSHSEIAAELELPLGTVKSQIRAGMIQLRTVLKELAQ